MMRPIESYIIPRPMTRRDWAMAMAVFASIGLTGCGTVDSLTSTVEAQAERMTGQTAGKAETCTVHYVMDIQTGATDTTTVCTEAK